MYYVKNTRTGKLLKSVLSGRVLDFSDKAMAEIWAKNLSCDSVLDATAWNSVRPTKYQVIEVTK